ncbi:MAG: DALR domain-containing protein [Microthrixaceae bacterium]
MIRLYDTAAGQVLPLEPRTPGQVSMYVCGPTVYGPPHLGHGRFSLVFDVLRRYLIWAGLDVTYVSNITDIDDKIIRRSQDEGRPWQEITEEFERVWFEAMDAIGVLRPDQVPHATGYVQQMVDMIQELVTSGAAYLTDDGVYLSVPDVDGYGLLAHQSLDEMLAGGGERRARGGAEASSGRLRHVEDGQARRAVVAVAVGSGSSRLAHRVCGDERSTCSVTGSTCTAAAMDLAFPHHENERAQAVALGRPFARRWAHNGFVEVAGEKMSKSLGNFTTLTDLIAQHDPRAYRLLVLQSHYRSPLEVTAATIGQAEASLDRLDALARRVSDVPQAAAAPEVMAGFAAAMDDNLDTPAVCAQLFGLVTEVNSLLDSGDTAAAAPLAAAWRSMLDALGLDVRDQVGEVPAGVTELALERDAARAAKDWAAADDLRDRLVSMGYVVEDGPDGTVVRPG